MTSSDNTPTSNLERAKTMLEDLRNICLGEETEIRNDFIQAVQEIPLDLQEMASMNAEEQSKTLLGLAQMSAMLGPLIYSTTMLKAISEDVWKEGVLENAGEAIINTVETMKFELECPMPMGFAQDPLASILGNNDEEDGIVTIFVIAVEGEEKEDVPGATKDDDFAPFWGPGGFPDLTKK